jgi:virginiamycin B lyase
LILRTARGLAAALFTVLALAAPASADVYWTNEGIGTIGRAEADGSSANDQFIAGATAPHGVAIDANFAYWAHEGDAVATGSIGRAPLGDPAAADQAFIATSAIPRGVALDNASIFWTRDAVPGPGGSEPAIGRATLAGFVISQNWVPAIGASPCGLTSDADKFFWALAGSPGAVMRSHGSFGPYSDFVPGSTSDPCGVAEESGLVYWANRGDGSIGRVNLDGVNPEKNFIDTGTPPASVPCGVAVDETHVYWTDQADEAIWRAEVSGSNPTSVHDTGAGSSPCGIAVDPTASAEPALHRFADTGPERHSEAATLVVRNTSSSVLDPTGATLAGADPGDFEITGDGCTVNVVAAGQICVMNVRFQPADAGAARARLLVTSNASDTPTRFALRGRGDARPPRFLSASLRPSTFEVVRGGRAEAPASLTVAATTFRYRLSEAARVVFAIERELKGRRVDGRCVKPRGANRGRPRCRRVKGIGDLADGADAGVNQTPFSGRLGKRKLLPGDYRAELVATDTAGNASSPQVLRFSVIESER